ncbi:uncharacterized protein LOC124122731 [Haliotis rufescens]|uniref:uncharacterized protein LOC124122731 n=1 Tax=Haliotis rufescens TaxID=6454 RepID=UPI00201F3EF4|nr:uncharacterized protein LOC124122731 [Haliotis rufescens]
MQDSNLYRGSDSGSDRLKNPKKCMIEIASSRLISTRELEGPAHAEECSELCRMSRKCYGVSYNGTNCLWADTATGVTADAGTTTYTQNSACVGDYYIKSTRYPGSPVEDLPPVNVPTSIYCATLCYGTVGCTGFTFEQKTHVCYRGQTFPSVDDYIPI